MWFPRGPTPSADSGAFVGKAEEEHNSPPGPECSHLPGLGCSLWPPNRQDASTGTTQMNKWSGVGGGGGVYSLRVSMWESPRSEPRVVLTTKPVLHFKTSNTELSES
jgi:hypothetical protein